MLTHSLVVKIVAKADRAEDVAAFLTGALPLAQAEAFTPVWFALRADATTFYIVDAFAGDADRTRHLEGPIAAALMANAEELLAAPPAIQPASVLASKVVAS
ncbi:MAG: antibiotic biosynthesis monooxygenase [Myxococcota bacterium]